MNTLSELRIRIPVAQMLDCMWYSDGSGCGKWGGLPLASLMPENFMLDSIRLEEDAQVISMTLKAVPEPSP